MCDIPVSLMSGQELIHAHQWGSGKEPSSPPLSCLLTNRCPWREQNQLSLTCSNFNIVYVSVRYHLSLTAIGNRTMMVCMCSQIHEMQRGLALNTSTQHIHNEVITSSTVQHTCPVIATPFSSRVSLMNSVSTLSIYANRLEILPDGSLSRLMETIIGQDLSDLCKLHHSTVCVSDMTHSNCHW